MSVTVASPPSPRASIEPDGEHLAGVVPLVEGMVDVEPLVALKADELAPEDGGENLGDFGLADPGLALEEERAAHLEGQKNRDRQPAIGHVPVPRQRGDDLVDGTGEHPERLLASRFCVTRGAWCVRSEQSRLEFLTQDAPRTTHH